MAESNHRLQASVEELRRALAPMVKLLKPMAKTHVVLRYDGTDLTFAAPGISVKVSAVGQWPTPVRVQAGLVELLAEALGEGDGQATLSFDGTRLRVGDWGSFSAELASDAPPAVDLMPPANLCEALYLGLRHRGEELRASGLEDKVREAQAECDKRLDKATKILAPLGIEKADLRALHEAKLQRLMGRLDKGELTP